MSSDRRPSDAAPSLRGALRPAPLAVLALIVAALLLNDWRTLDSSFLISDQVYIGVVTLKYRQPDLFPSDLSLRLLDYYPRTYLGVVSLFMSVTGGFKPALFTFNILLVLVFAAGMYLLIFDATQNVWIAVAIATASLAPRLSFGGNQWLVVTSEAYLPRTQTLAMAPWLLLALSRSIGQWRIIGIFAALGVAANFHPLSTVYLAISFGCAVLLFRTCRKRHLAILAVSVGVYWIAAAPYYLEVRRASRHRTVAASEEFETPTPEQIGEVMQFRLPWLLLPSARDTARIAGYMMLPLIAGAAGVWVRRRALTPRDTTVLAFFAGVLICAVGMTALLLLLCYLFGFQRSTVFTRGLRLLYLPLWVCSGWLIADLWNRPGRKAHVGAWIVAAALLVPMHGVEQMARWVRWRGQIPRFHVLEFDEDFQAMCRWAREQTSRDALFLTPPERGWIVFRLFAHRGAVVTSKELALVMYDPNLGYELYKRYRRAEAAYENASPAGVIEVAKQYDADYIVVLDREIGGAPVFQSGPYRVYAVTDGEPPNG